MKMSQKKYLYFAGFVFFLSGASNTYSAEICYKNRHGKELCRELRPTLPRVLQPFRVVSDVAKITKKVIVKTAEKIVTRENAKKERLAAEAASNAAHIAFVKAEAQRVKNALESRSHSVTSAVAVAQQPTELLNDSSSSGTLMSSDDTVAQSQVNIAYCRGDSLGNEKCFDSTGKIVRETIVYGSSLGRVRPQPRHLSDQVVATSGSL